MGSLNDFPIWAIKAVGTLILFLFSLIFGLLPMKLQRNSDMESSLRNLLISLSNCFAGGVFVCTVILEMFPDVTEILNDALTKANITTDFPLGEFTIRFGFIIILVLEQFVMSCCQNSWLHHGHSHIKGSVFENTPDETRYLLDDDFDNDLAVVTNQSAGSVSKKRVTLGESSVLCGNSISYADSNNDEEETRSQQSHCSSMTYETFYSEHGTHHRVRRMRKTKSLASVQSISTSNFRTYMLVFAISLHSLFEGLSVGLMTKTQVLLQILIALLIHKSIIAFSIGVQLVDADLPTKVVLICLTIFSLMVPLGVGFGLILLNSVDSIVKLFISGILQGIATGTFLYLTFFEVLPHELSIADEKKMLKIFFVILGYFVITGICYFENSKTKPNTNATLVC